MNQSFKLKRPKNLKLMILNIVVVLGLGDTHFFNQSNMALYLFYALFMFSTFIVFFYLCNIKISKWCMVIVLAEMLVLIFSFFNGRLNFYYQKIWASTLLLTIWFDIQYRRNRNCLIYSTKIALYILLYIDMIDLLMGDYSGARHILSLAGHKNYHAYLLIFTLGFDYIDSALKKKRYLRIIPLSTLAIFLYAMRIYQSASMFVGVILFFVLLFLLPKLPEQIDYFRIFLIAYVVIEVAIIIIGNVDIIQNFLIYLQRDITFSGRTAMWQKAWEMFTSNIIIGHGYLADVNIYSMYNLEATNNCHNYILNILISGGIVYFAAYSAVFLKIGKNIKEFLNKKNVYIHIYSAILMVILVMGFSETIIIANSLFIPLLVIGCNLCKGDGGRVDE